MRVEIPFPKGGPDAAAGVLKLAVLAVGGQGGGVVTNWITDLFEAGGWHAQATSVAGVAQRTGATIYYVEAIPAHEAEGREPILALAPAAGDVDVLVAAELMEAGRAVQRGFVTPDRTTLIASSHRALAVGEKVIPGNGILDPAPVLEACEAAAARFLHADLEAAAVANGSVISASLFGALAAAEVLPFERAAFEDTIRRSGKGVERSLAAFSAGYDAVLERGTPEGVPATEAAVPMLQGAPLPASHAPEGQPEGRGSVEGPDELRRVFSRLRDRVEVGIPEPARDMARRGLAKVVDFQDVAYGAEYLDELAAVAALDDAGHGFALTEAAAKHLANAMAYDDVIRVADRKTRASRMGRVRGEVGVREGQVLYVTEYMHPRMAEVCGCLPAGLGRAIEARPKLFGTLDKLVSRGRRVRTDGVFWFSVLYGVSALRPHRRRLLRHSVERAHWTEWLSVAKGLAPRHYALAVEVLRCRRLIKGYSDTHVRGLSKFDRVLGALPLLEVRADGADWLRRLRTAALADEKGEALDGALRTVASL